MNGNRKKLLLTLAIAALLVLAFSIPAFAAGESGAETGSLYGTFWSLVPPVIAIVLALITKEV